MPGAHFGLEYVRQAVWLRRCLAGDLYCQPPLGRAPLLGYAGLGWGHASSVNIKFRIFERRIVSFPKYAGVGNCVKVGNEGRTKVSNRLD